VDTDLGKNLGCGEIGCKITSSFEGCGIGVPYPEGIHAPIWRGKQGDMMGRELMRALEQ